MDTRPPCRVCKGLGTRPGPKRRFHKAQPTVCSFCFGTGRQPQIVDSGPVHLNIDLNTLT